MRIQKSPQIPAIWWPERQTDSSTRFRRYTRLQAARNDKVFKE
jgi:hypothetical protein